MKTKVSFPTKKLQMQVLRSLFMEKMSLSESLAKRSKNYVPRKGLKAGVFYISRSNLTQLQKDIAKEPGVLSGVSGNDAICGLVWRCLARAILTARKATSKKGELDADPDDESILTMLCDGRPNFSLDLPPTYLGNMAFHILSRLPLSSLTSSDQTVATTTTIRKDAKSLNSHDLLDLYTVLKNLCNFDYFEKWKREGMPFIEGNHLFISSLIMLPMESVCFGDHGIFGNGGLPIALRPLMEGFNKFLQVCFVLPRNKNGSVEFVANLLEEEMEVLMEDEEFGKYAVCLCRRYLVEYIPIFGRILFYIPRL